MAKTKEALGASDVQPLSDGRFAVRSRTNLEWHGVDTVNGACPCAGFYYNEKCAHMALLKALGFYGTDSRAPRVEGELHEHRLGEQGA